MQGVEIANSARRKPPETLAFAAIDERPGFTAMLQRLLGNGVRTIIVETASRFARGSSKRWVGASCNAGVNLVATDIPDSFLDETPTAVLIRQVLGAMSQFEKQALVAKLRKACERKKAATGKCGGRKIAAELEAAGHVTNKGTPYGAVAVARMIA